MATGFFFFLLIALSYFLFPSSHFARFLYGITEAALSKLSERRPIVAG